MEENAFLVSEGGIHSPTEKNQAPSQDSSIPNATVLGSYTGERISVPTILSIKCFIPGRTGV